MSSEPLVPIGYVARAHGVRGEVRVHLYDVTVAVQGAARAEHAAHQSAQTLFEVDQVALDGKTRAVLGTRPGTKGAVLLALEGITDRDAAEALRGRRIAVPRDRIALAEGEYLAVDLVGCTAVLADGTVWGVVEDVIAGPQDRLVVRDGDVVRELPLVAELVRDVDVAARRIAVDPPEGLPELEVERP